MPERTVELAEWDRKFVAGAALSGEDLRLSLQLGDEGKLDVSSDASGIEIRSRAWIGFVRFEFGDVRVTPKLVGEELGVLQMVDYAWDLGGLARLASHRELATGGVHLLDLVALLLTEEARTILRAGVLEDYKVVEDALPMLRGRLRLLGQLRTHGNRVYPLECEYDEFSADILENRILSAGLSVARTRATSERIRRAAARLHSDLSDLVSGDSFEFIPEPPDYHRRNDYYRRAHTWALLLLRSLAFPPSIGERGARTFGFLINMNQLFERFVSRLLADAFRGSTVNVWNQRRHGVIWDVDQNRSYTDVIPDVLLEESHAVSAKRVPVDAKYKLYDGKRVEEGDLYQGFTYALSLASGSPPRAVIIYPAARTLPSVSLELRRETGVPQAFVQVVGLDVPGLLRDLANGTNGHGTRLRELVA